MDVKHLHPWNLDPKQAMELQERLLVCIRQTWDGRQISTVAGVDVSYKGGRARAAIVVFHYPELTPLDWVTGELPVDFPYIPGLLAFREGPVVMAAWKGLRAKPDLVLFDAQGIAHPRGIGLASHMGLWLELPCIGVAKSRLYGHHVTPGTDRGDYAELKDERDPQRVIGMVVRTRTGVKPVYVSVGHLIDLDHAVDFVSGCCTRYRLPEPTRWAHKVAAGEEFPREFK